MDFKNTSDFVSGFWNLYVMGIVTVSLLFCIVLLWSQSRAKSSAGQTTGHVWDEDLQEFNNPLPGWWRWMFYLTIFFGMAYLYLFPGFGNNPGSLGWTMRGQWEKENATADEQFKQAYGPLLTQDVAMVAADPKAREAGQRLFVTYCAQCHGSDAKGAKGFPNLTDEDWLWGGSADKIKETITLGRNAMMPAKGLKPDLNADQIKDLANFVRSLSGLPVDSLRAAQGKELFAQACAACHGPEGKGNVGIAPNLSDKIWLYGSSEDTVIETITKGRVNRMPAFGEFLGEAKVHLLAAYVYGLSTHEKVVAPAAAEAAK